MKRSVGVTVIAVLSLIGSLFTLTMGLLMVLLAILIPGHNAPKPPGLPPVFFRAMLLVVSLMYLAPAVWGIFTSIGLFRLKNWARLSIIVFSVLLILMSGFTGLISLVVPIPPVPNNAMDPSVMVGMRVLMGVSCFTLLGIGIWWVVFFNRARVKQQFFPLTPMFPGGSAEQMSLPQPALATQTPTIAHKRPLSITILGWWLLVSSFFVPLSFAIHAPAIAFLRVLTGWPAILYYLIIAGLLLYIGIGLLRLKPAARVIGIAYFSYAFVNAAVFNFWPGAHARMLDLVERQQSVFPWMQLGKQAGLQFDLAPFFVIGACLGLAGVAVPLYFLITRKQAFEKPASELLG